MDDGRYTPMEWEQFRAVAASMEPPTPPPVVRRSRRAKKADPAYFGFRWVSEHYSAGRNMLRRKAVARYHHRRLTRALACPPKPICFHSAMHIAYDRRRRARLRKG